MTDEPSPCSGGGQPHASGLGQGRSVDAVDYGAVFAAQPTAYLVMDPDLVIVEANEAYLQVLGRTREELIGRPVFEAFPPALDALDEQGRNPLQVSFERARDSGLPDQMPLFHYDVLDPVSGEMQQRFWSLISSAVPGPDGRTVLVLQRVEDVTDYVADRRARQAERDRGQAWERRVEQVEADLFARAQELRAARDAEAQANQRLAALADVALQLAQAQSVEELTDVIVVRGLTALGADGGALAVRDDAAGVLRLAISDGLGQGSQQIYAQLALDSPLPAAATARTGQRILLPDEQASLAFDPQMRQVHADTGCQAWAVVPLRLKEELLGSLVVGWSAAQRFSPPELGLLDVLAGQTAHGLARILSRQAERAAALASHRMSEALQRSLLTDPPQPAGLQVAVRYRPASEQAQVGGDWYDAFEAGDGPVSVVIGDVAGHDRDAAATMGQLRNLLRGVAHTSGQRPASVLTALDRALRDMRVDALATAVLATVEPVGGSRNAVAEADRLLRWSNAGHPPPVLIDPDGTARLLQAEPDLLLGLDPDSRRSDQEVVMPAGSTLLLYTDGLVERRGAGIDQGLAWLLGAAQDWASSGHAARTTVLPDGEGAEKPGDGQWAPPGPYGPDLDGLCDGLLEQVAGSAEDDVALLAVRVLPTVLPRP